MTDLGMEGRHAIGNNLTDFAAEFVLQRRAGPIREEAMAAVKMFGKLTLIASIIT